MGDMENNQKLESLRHSLAHLLAAAVLELYPGTKNTIGPAIDTGFYYDFEFPTPLSQDDLPKIEEKMREILKTWKEFSHKEVSAEEAREFFKGNPYKLELIDEIIGKGEKITLYTCGFFTDLCRGGHIDDASKIQGNSFKLDRIAGAYWRGNEKGAQLTRIYGLAFESKAALDAHLAMVEEAKKRDHKKLGKELDLFTFSELVGPGLPLWTPKGTILRQELDAFVWELRKAKGYQRVTIPHITKRSLYETSGHWDKFKEDLFKINTREGKEFAMKPMSCPHHTQIFDRVPHSYREMPERYAETTMVYRDEQSGELSGLSRVLCITQDDAHVFCRKSQLKEEFFKIWDMIDTFYKTFGFELKVRLSFHDHAKMEKYLGTEEIWTTAENALREIATERGADFYEAPGEAALYGPKIDFISTDSLGRQLQVATIQLDMNMPERFDLTCTNEKGEKERIVMIHCAIMGSLERFSAVLIEHLAGAFPTWLAPVQVMILPISDTHFEYARAVVAELQKHDIRYELNDTNGTLGKKIREGKTQKIPYLLVIGDKEIAANAVGVESRDKGPQGQIALDTFITSLVEEISTRK